MKLISTRELKLKAADVWGLLDKEGELVVTSHGRPIALLTNIEEEDIEETVSAMRRARAQMAVSRIRRRAAEKGLDRISMEEIDAEIKAARRSRSGR